MRTRDEVQADIRGLHDERHKAIVELNERVFFPRLKLLQDECAALGHRARGAGMNMVRTRAWTVCGYCGASYDFVDLEKT